jgi:hypothetical protein
VQGPMPPSGALPPSSGGVGASGPLPGPPPTMQQLPGPPPFAPPGGVYQNGGLRPFGASRVTNSGFHQPLLPKSKHTIRLEKICFDSNTVITVAQSMAVDVNH